MIRLRPESAAHPGPDSVPDSAGRPVPGPGPGSVRGPDRIPGSIPDPFTDALDELSHQITTLVGDITAVEYRLL